MRDQLPVLHHDADSRKELPHTTQVRPGCGPGMGLMREQRMGLLALKSAESTQDYFC